MTELDDLEDAASNQDTQQGWCSDLLTDQLAAAANPLPEAPKDGHHSSGHPKD